MVGFSKTYAVAAVASLCLSTAVANPVGFCSGKSMGIYRDPTAPACTTSFYQCNHGADAFVGACGASTRFSLPGGEGSWNWRCDWESNVPECQAPVIESFCNGKAAGDYPVGEGSADCDQFWRCDGTAAAATLETCATNFAFDGTTCVAIENVMSCPLESRVCAGAAAGFLSHPTIDCSGTYFVCDGANAGAAVLTCAAGEVWNGISCQLPGNVPTCRDPVGYCTRNPVFGSFKDPTVPPGFTGMPSCSASYWRCESGDVDAQQLSCPAGQVPQFTGETPTTDFACVAESEQCTVCDGATALAALPSDCNQYVACAGTDPAVLLSCAAGEGFDAATATCKPAAEVDACVTTVDPIGFCAGTSGAGVFVDPNASDSCSRIFWTCNWAGATNANVRECPVGTVPHLNAPEPTWNYWCKAAPAGC